MHIRLDPHSGEPIYRQIVEQVKIQVARGTLQEGERLPSIRTLANDLGINFRTVVKAYEELEAMGLTVMKQGQGVYITSSRSGASASVRRKTIASMAQRLFAEASRIGATPPEIFEILQETAEQMEMKPWAAPSSKP